MPTLPIFVSHYPRLRALHLKMSTIIPSHGIPSLTHLILDRIHASGSNSLSNTHLCNFLRGCLSLQVIHIHACALEGPAATSSTSRDVVLPQLRKLSVVGYGHGYCIDISSKLMLPPQCLVSMPAWRSNGTSHLAHVLAGATTSNYTSMQAVIGSPPFPHKTVPFFPITLFDASRSAGLHLSSLSKSSWTVRVSPPDILGHVETWITEGLFSSPLFHNIRALELSGRFIYLLRRAPVSSILDALPRVDTLSMRMPHPQDVPHSADSEDALRVLLPLSRDAPVPCPLLTTLAIESFSIIDPGLICVLAISRRLAGYPLWRIVLRFTGTSEDAPVIPSDMDAVGSVVDEFVVVHPRCGQAQMPEDLRRMDVFPPECTAEGELMPFWPRWEYSRL
ncbi:hypothetical protein C8Q76DRAFT_744032 [Earliella scabrosa]|nr:hypothetical protein C8Q76DRAFT_744032 [Earliella scabrosa]